MRSCADDTPPHTNKDRNTHTHTQFYLHGWTPQCHVVSVRLLEVLGVRVHMVAGVRVRMVRVHHGGRRWVEGAGHWGEGVRPRVARHLNRPPQQEEEVGERRRGKSRCSLFPQKKRLIITESVITQFLLHKYAHSQSKPKQLHLSTYLVVSRMLWSRVKAFTGARTRVAWSTGLQWDTEEKNRKRKLHPNGRPRCSMSG